MSRDLNVSQTVERLLECIVDGPEAEEMHLQLRMEFIQASTQVGIRLTGLRQASSVNIERAERGVRRVGLQFLPDQLRNEARRE